MYDEKDLKTILARAVEIQNRTGSDRFAGPQEKLSLEEIEDIARESGLSPEYVRQAAIELEGVSVEEPFFLDTGNNHDAELMGFATGNLDQKTWAELRSIIEQEFDTVGTVKRYTGKISWAAKPAGVFKFFRTRKSPVVEITTLGYKSTIRIRKSLRTYNKLLVPAYAALAGAVMLFPVMLDNEAGIIFAVAALAGVSRLFFKWCDTLKLKSKEKLKETMTQLQTIVTRRYTASGDNTYDNLISTEPVEGEKQTEKDGVKNVSRKKVH